MLTKIVLIRNDLFDLSLISRLMVSVSECSNISAHAMHGYIINDHPAGDAEFPTWASSGDLVPPTRLIGSFTGTLGVLCGAVLWRKQKLIGQ